MPDPTPTPQSQTRRENSEAATSLEEMFALVPCETPGRAEQEEIIARIGALRPAGVTRLMFGGREVVVSSWRRGWQDYVRALHELAPEPAVDQVGRASPKRYCLAGVRRIAAHMGRRVGTVIEALDWLDANGIITCVNPGDPTWPAGAGNRGRLRAPTWGVLAALVSHDNPQLRFPMHGIGLKSAGQEYNAEWENAAGYGQGPISTIPGRADQAQQSYASPGREERDGDTLDPGAISGDVHGPSSNPIRGSASADPRPAADALVPPAAAVATPAGTNVPPPLYDAGEALRSPERSAANQSATLSVALRREALRSPERFAPEALRSAERSARGGVGGALPLPFGALNKSPIPPLPPHSSAHPAERYGDRSAPVTAALGRDVFPLSVELLCRPERLDEWFDWATARNWVSPSLKLHVFATARSMVRRRADLRNPVGAFIAVVKQRLWTRQDIFCRADEEWARQALLELDRE